MNQRPLDFQSNALPLSYLSYSLWEKLLFKNKKINFKTRVINGDRTHDLLIHNQIFYHWTIITDTFFQKYYKKKLLKIDGKGNRTLNPWIMIPIFYQLNYSVVSDLILKVSNLQFFGQISSDVFIFKKSSFNEENGNRTRSL